MSDKRLRIGVVAASPLVLWGLVGIVEQLLPLQAVPVSLEALLDTTPEGEDFAAVLLVPVPSSKSDLTKDPNGVEALCALLSRIRRRHPAHRLIVVGTPLAPGDVQKVIGAGAKGYLLETAGEAEIRMAMEVVLDGSIWAPRKVLARLIDEGRSAAVRETSAEELSVREHEVLNLLMNGRSNREIAAALGIEPATVKAHLGRMLRKTRSRNRLEMTLRIMEQMEGATVQQLGR
jgi:DNA-binding NarL/FixJ family response regulator